VTDLCPDCQVEPGTRHSEGCDVARCNLHGTQFISCDFCIEYDEDDNEIVLFPDAKPTIWTGAWPNTSECREYGYWTSNPIWLTRGQTRTEDLNSFITDCFRGLFTWNVEQEKWLRTTETSGTLEA